MRNLFTPGGLMLLFFLSLSQLSFAQDEVQKLTQTILKSDSLFWNAYNSCDTSGYHKFIASDVEFYHDKGGITLGLEKLLEITKKNLCGPSDYRLRREAVAGTVNVFPMESDGVIYGAVISGEHVFYVRQAGAEKLSGLARFTHLWILKDGSWKMTRILSYDHGPAPQVHKKNEIRLSEKVLAQYAGYYRGPKSGDLAVTPEKDVLILSIQQQKFTLHPETQNQFFVKDRDLSFEFIKEQGTVHKLIVRENGQIVEEVQFVRKK